MRNRRYASCAGCWPAWKGLLPCGCGTTHCTGHHCQPDFTLVVRYPGLLRRLMGERNPTLLAEAYFGGQ